MVFDESEVRKIIVDCKKVLDYLAVAEVIESIEDLVQFVRDLSPCLSKVSSVRIGALISKLERNRNAVQRYICSLYILHFPHLNRLLKKLSDALKT